MKPYGHEPKDGQTCKYGCCGSGKANVSNKSVSRRERVNKAARHRARQKGKREIRTGAME